MDDPEKCEEELLTVLDRSKLPGIVSKEIRDAFRDLRKNQASNFDRQYRSNTPDEVEIPSKHLMMARMRRTVRTVLTIAVIMLTEMRNSIGKEEDGVKIMVFVSME